MGKKHLLNSVHVIGPDNMKTNHPDYKGYDLFDEDDKNHIL